MTTNTATATTLRMGATAKSVHVTQGQWTTDYSLPQSVDISAVVATPEVAEEIAALFPKSAKVSAGRITGSAQGTGYVGFNARLLQDGVNGGRNETGLRRLASVLRAAEKHGIAIEWTAQFANSYATREDFEAALNA